MASKKRLKRSKQGKTKKRAGKIGKRLRSSKKKAKMSEKRMAIISKNYAKGFQGESSRNEDAISQLKNDECKKEYLCARKNEMEKIEAILTKSIANRSSTSIYISGPPGSGKTAAIKASLTNLSSLYEIDTVFLNCASTSTYKGILRLIFDQLKIEDIDTSRSNVTLEDMFSSAKRSILIILDEIDYLDSKDHKFLYKILQWPISYRMVNIVGIANSLDLCERILSKLKLDCLPETITFQPYTRIQLEEILIKKFREEKNIVDEAIELCARKVASMTGDVRTAFQIARQMYSNNRLKENVDGENIKRNSCQDVLKTLSNIYSSPINRVRLPIQQKVLLAIMLRLVDKCNSISVNKCSLENCYRKVCEWLSIPPLDVDSLRCTLNLLESQSIMQCKSLSYQLLIDAQTAIRIIADTTLIKQINGFDL